MKINYVVIGVFLLVVAGLGLMYGKGAPKTETGSGGMQVVATKNPVGTTTTNTKAKTMDTQIKTSTVHGAVISTSMGNIEVAFSEASAPNTVANFISLSVTKFYDGTKFHRVISNFMIQGGDPLSKDDTKAAYWGTGGPGYQKPDELSGKEVYTYGTLAMANSGPNTNGSQFFIVSANPKVDLPPLYTVFGKVTSGMDIVEKIQNVPTDKRNDRPLEAVVIKSVTLK